jgi:hypothetical protein
MGNIAKKIRSNLDQRRAAYDALPKEKQNGYKRPGSMKKKCKQRPGSQK